MAPQRASPLGPLPPGVDDPWALRDGFGFKADGRDFRWIRPAPGQGRLQTADSAGVRSGRPVWQDVLSEEKWLKALSPSGRTGAMGLKRIVPIPTSLGGFCLTFGALGRTEDPKDPANPAGPTASAPAPAKTGEPSDAERKLADNLRALRLGRDSLLSLPPAWVGHPRLRICAEADAINALEGPSASRPAAALAGFDLRAEPLGPGRLFVSAQSAQTGRSFAGYVDLRLAKPQAEKTLEAHRALGASIAPAGFAARLTRPEPPSSSLHALALTDPQGSPAQLAVSWDARSGNSRWLLFADREGKEGEAPATLPLRLGADARIVGLLGGLLFYFERAPQGAGAAPSASEKELLFAPLTRKGLGRKSHLAAALAQAKLIDWGNEAIEGAAIARSVSPSPPTPAPAPAARGEPGAEDSSGFPSRAKPRDGPMPWGRRKSPTGCSVSQAETTRRGALRSTFFSCARLCAPTSAWRRRAGKPRAKTMRTRRFCLGT